MKMKKIVVLALLVVFTMVSVFASPEEVAVYRHLYNNAPSVSAQLDLLRAMAEMDLTGAGEFYAEALRRLVSTYRNITNVTEKNSAAEQVIILSDLLGAEKYTPAASDLWLISEVCKDDNQPVARASALMALGRIRATTYLPHVVRVLNDLNLQPTSDRLAGERVAFGAIIALEKYQDPSGYIPVFLASEGWYTNRIRDQARRSLPLIADDPIPFLIQMIRGTQYGLPVKLAALRNVEASDADNASKANVAVEALAEGWRVGSGGNQQTRTTATNMRMLALSMLQKYKVESEAAVYASIHRSFSEASASNDERLSAVRALGFQGTDEAARRLSGYLNDLNTRNVRSGGRLTNDETTRLRAIIDALGQTGNSNGRAALTAISTGNYTPAIQRQARDALGRIGN